MLLVGHAGGAKRELVAKFAESKLFQDEAAFDQRLLHLDKKRSQDILAGVSASNSRISIQEADFKYNIQLFWDRVKWAESGLHEYAAKGDTPTVTDTNNAYLRALVEKARRIKNSAESHNWSFEELAEERRSLQKAIDGTPYAGALRAIQQSKDTPPTLYSDELRKLLDKLRKLLDELDGFDEP